MSLYQRILGHPFVFNHVRPFFVGGIDWTVLYRELDAGPDSVVLDVGCGTGIAHRYLQGYRSYFGFDTDALAIEAARRLGPKSDVEYCCRIVGEDDVRRIQPNRVLLSGLLHHLPDSEALTLLRALARAPSVERIATADTVYLPGQHISNALAFLDRGRHVRYTEGFLALARQAHLDVIRHQIVRSHPTRGLALYLIMTLSPLRA